MSKRMRFHGLASSLAAVCAGVLLAAAPAARADFGIALGSFFVKAHAPVTTSPAVVGEDAGDPNNGTVAGAEQWTQAIEAAPSVTQAGAHPDVSTSFALNTRTDPASGTVVPDGNVEDLDVGLPPGLVGNPQATPICSRADFGTTGPAGSCPVTSQVGVAVLTYLPPGDASLGAIVPVYNIAPTPGAPASLGFKVPQLNAVPVILDASVRSGGDYGLTVSSNDVSTQALVFSTTVTLWGVPADPVHDPQRWLPGSGDSGSWGASVSDDEAETPFLTYPTDCDSGPLTATLSADSWQDPGAFVSASSRMPAPTGCEDLAFGGPGAPVSLTAQPLTAQPLTAQLDTTVADSPAGLNVQLTLPYNDDPGGLATPTLRDASVTLPAGMAVSPSGANGLVGCSDQDIALSSAAPGSCPPASKIATATITTPLLAQPLQGAVYLGTPLCDPCTNADAQDGRMLRLFIDAEGDGVVVKLAGTVSANPQTGQLTATFDDNPQLPFTELDLDFFGGPQAALATPEQCGTYTTDSVLTPWSAPESGPPVTSLSSFQVNSGCVSGFSPSFSAGVTNPQAGAYSPFVLSFSRSDTDQELSGLSVTLPPGMLANLSQVPLCTDSDADAGTCPDASQVGTVEVGSGPGTEPLFLPGKVYLTGPYEGGQYGLAVVVPAVAGPFNLGTVVVRQAIHIDPETAQVSVTSDPFPTILDGIPLRIRSVSVDLNRSNFTVAPTSCNPMAVTGTLTSTGGLTANVSSRFQVGGCQDIGFSPKLKIALTGKGKTKSGDHPTLTATLTEPAGQANIHTARVALPLSLALDPKNSTHVCAYATAQAVHGGAVGCPANTVVGTATAVTPLLSQPLTGNVYLVQGIRTNAQGQQIKTLPSLLVPLRGQIALDLRAQTSVSGGKLVTTFPSIPDAPVSKFTLKLNGGKKGLLVITGRGQSICQAKQVGNADLGAQSGKTMTANMTLSTPCGKPAKLKILSRRVRSGSLTLAVKTSKRGRLTVTGNGLKSYSKTLSAGTHQIRVAAKATAQKAPARSRPSARKSRPTHRKTLPKPSAKTHAVTRKVKVRVQLTPANARAAMATFTVRM